MELLRRADVQVSILYGNRRAETVMFAEELADLKDAHPARLELVHLLSREAREVDLLSGRLDGPKLRAPVGGRLHGGDRASQQPVGPHRGRIDRQVHRGTGDRG